MTTNIPGVFRTYRYIVDIFTVIIGDEIIEIDPNFISSLGLEKDFDNDAFPVLQLQFSMSDSVYYKIIENKQNVQFKLRVMKYIYDENNKIRSKKQLINDVFISFIEEEAPQVDKKLKENVSDESLLVANKSLQVFLFKQHDLVNTKNYINGVFHDVTLTDMITYILSTSGIKKVLLAPFHNLKTYDEIIIPPMTLLDSIDYLENVYDGFYNNGSVKFFDYDCMYFIDKGRRNNVFRNNEHTQTIISILDPTNMESMSSGCSLDDTNRRTYINVPPSAFTSSGVSIINEHINANNAIIISPTTGDITTIEPPVREITGKVYKLLIDRYSNKRAISKYNMLSSENDGIINIGVNGIDVASFTPNKEFKIIFENQAINKTLGGDYRISKAIFMFSKEGTEFSLMGDIQLKKIR